MARLGYCPARSLGRGLALGGLLLGLLPLVGSRFGCGGIVVLLVLYVLLRAALAPLVLVGVEHWSVTVPVWPVLRALGEGRSLGASVHLVDTVEDAREVALAARG